MTDVVIHALDGGSRARIKCGEYVNQLAVYNGLVAVLASKFVTVYERAKQADQGFEVRGRIAQTFPCDQFVLASSHIAVCHKQRLRCYDFSGCQCALTFTFPA